MVRSRGHRLNGDWPPDTSNLFTHHEGYLELLHLSAGRDAGRLGQAQAGPFCRRIEVQIVRDGQIVR